ncbi:hypothetical protein [Petrachloros mirabilis]
MEVLDLLKRAVKACADVIRWGAEIQGPARKALVKDLQDICLNCEAAYDAVLTRLIPVKDAFSNKDKLSTELRAFRADSQTRDKFKPEHLCGQVDQLLARLGSNLDPLKYSVDYRRIEDLRKSLKQFGSFDAAIYQSYDDLTSQLDQIATQINDPTFDSKERAQYATHVINDFETELRSAKKSVREAKDQTVGII